MKKYIRLLITVALLLTATLSTISFANDDMTVMLENTPVNFNRLHNNEPVGAPFIKNSRTYVPIRVISEDLEYKVDWNPKTLTAKISKGNKTVEIKIGESTAMVNGVRTAIDIQGGKVVDTKAMMKNGRTYVPVRFISEAMGDKVEYRMPQTSNVKVLTVYINCTELPVEKPVVTPPVVKPPTTSPTGLVPNFQIIPHNLTGAADYNIFFENFKAYEGKMTKVSTSLVSHTHLLQYKVKDPYTGEIHTVLNDNEYSANMVPNYYITTLRLKMFNITKGKQNIQTGKPLIESLPKVGELMTWHIKIDMKQGPSEVYEIKIPYKGFTEVMYTSGTRIK